MSDHLVLCVDRLLTTDSLPSVQGTESPEASGKGSRSHSVDAPASVISVKEAEKHGVSDEEEPLIQTVECRICQEEDSIKNLDVPCVCSGSLKYAHRTCVQRWCNEKGDITCEICHQFVVGSVWIWGGGYGGINPYRPGYTAPPPPPQSEDMAIDISEAWTVSGDPRLLAMAAAERPLLGAEYDEYADTNASGAAFCRSVALILMALLLLRHAVTLTNSDGDDNEASTFFSLFMLRAAGFLLPCYIMAWAVSILQQRRQRQEAAAALAATEVAFMIQAGQRQGLHFTVARGPAVTPLQEPPQ